MNTDTKQPLRFDDLVEIAARGLTLALLGFLFSMPAFGQATDYQFTASALMEDCEQVFASEPQNPEAALICLAKVTAVRNTMMAVSTLVPEASGLGCLPASLSGGQAVRVFLKFGNENPQLLHITAEFIVIRAFMDAFPCQ